MIVTTDTRLASMLSAVTEVILPAVQDSGFAFEQTQLLAAHLQALRTQEEHAQEFERLELEYLRRLASDLAVPELPTGNAESIADTRAVAAALKTAIIEFLTAQGESGDDASIRKSDQIVLAAEHAQSLRERCFYSCFGYEDSDPPFGSVPAMMDQFRAEFPHAQKEKA